MFSEPKIIATKDLKVRAYITFYFNGERIREYNGNSLNLPIHPNRSTTNSERNKVLSKLHYEIKKALEKGWNPLIDDKPKPILATDILKQVLSELSATHPANENARPHSLIVLRDIQPRYAPAHCLGLFALDKPTRQSVILIADGFQRCS